jgi:ribosomal protein L11 methyltransferase
MNAPTPGHGARLWSLVVPADDADSAADQLWGAGATAVVVEERGATVRLTTDVAPPGPTPLGWRLISIDADEAASGSWLEDLPPVRVGPWTVHRPELDVTADGAVAIDPSRAFGSGHHPTTRLALEALAPFVGPGVRLLDVGCGSGVLAVAAAVSGARCAAVDIDPEAVAETRANAARNGVAERVSCIVGTVAAVRGEFDVVTANMLIPAITTCAADLAAATARGGVAVITGVLESQAPRVQDALGLTEQRRLTADDWVGLVYGHRS